MGREGQEGARRSEVGDRQDPEGSIAAQQRKNGGQKSR